MVGASPGDFYKLALRYVRREYPDGLSWARRLTKETFVRMRASQFLVQYVWVVYAAGFKVEIVRRKFPALQAAFADLNLKRLARMRSPNRALQVINNERKALSVLRGARSIAAEGFANFKARILREGPAALVELPGIGPITKDHLARNIGLANVAKDDIWIQRVRRALGYTDKDLLARRLSSQFRQPEGVIDYVIWQYCSDNAWKEDGFGSLRAACRARTA